MRTAPYVTATPAEAVNPTVERRPPTESRSAHAEWVLAGTHLGGNMFRFSDWPCSGAALLTFRTENHRARQGCVPAAQRAVCYPLCPSSSDT